MLLLGRRRYSSVATVLMIGAVTLAGGCSSSPNPAVTTRVTTVTVTHSPSPSAEDIPTSSASPDEPPTSFPLDAVMSLASVAIDASVVTVGGYVTGVVEDGGVCTYTLQAINTETVSVATSGLANVTLTSCGSVDVSLSEIPRGSYEVRLTYTSAAGSVTSEPLPLEVP